MVIYGNYLVGGRALALWKMMELVSWDDELPNIWNNEIHVPNHQPELVWCRYNIQELR